ncbi:MAG: ParA family protein [Gammaproteobacteria bacterium]
MSVISVCTSKGGAGKTTLAEIILGTITERGFKTAAIDVDLNHTLSDWVSNFSSYPIAAHVEVDETKIVPLAEQLERDNDLVVIDTAGAAMQGTVFAIGCADLVLIPVQLSSADVIEAIKTAKLVQSASQMTRREIPHRVVFTDYQSDTNIAAHIEKEIEKCALPALRTKLKRLVAFKEMTFTGKVPAADPARELCTSLIDELVELGALPFITKGEGGAP